MHKATHTLHKSEPGSACTSISCQQQNRAMSDLQQAHMTVPAKFGGPSSRHCWRRRLQYPSQITSALPCTESPFWKCRVTPSSSASYRTACTGMRAVAFGLACV